MSPHTPIHPRLLPLSRRVALTLAVASLAGLVGCAATETSRTVETTQVATAGQPYSGPREPIAVPRPGCRDCDERPPARSGA